MSVNLDPFESQYKLASQANRLSEARDFTGALEVIERMSELFPKWDCLFRATFKAARTGNAELAESLANRITTDDIHLTKSNAVRFAVDAFVNKGDYLNANRVAKTIPDSWMRSATVSCVAFAKQEHRTNLY